LLSLIAIATLFSVVHAAETQTSLYNWKLPPGFPVPLVPENNPMSVAKVVLGKRLFFSTQLSANEQYSCASCHRPELAFTDGRQTALGSTGESHTRNTPSLINTAYNATLGWANNVLVNLETQHLVPLFNSDPVEMGLNSDNLNTVLRRINSSKQMSSLVARAFPELKVDHLSIELVNKALASYIRTLIIANSPYDRYLYYDDRSVMSAQAIEGMRLFFSNRLKCSECHASFNFSGPVVSENVKHTPSVFHNTGLYNLDGRGAYPDAGLFLITKNPADMGAFRAPSLRNVTLTAPYMHDGTIGSLELVIDFYAHGGRAIVSGPLAGDGRDNPFKRSEIAGFTLTPVQKKQLIAFLKTLSSSF